MTTLELAVTMPDARAAHAPADDASAAEARYLESVRRRVAWQADAAARQRAATAPPERDVLDIGVLWRLVDARPDAPRAAEWRAFLVELRDLADDRGRLPDVLERLVRVVLGDLL